MKKLPPTSTHRHAPIGSGGDLLRALVRGDLLVHLAVGLVFFFAAIFLVLGLEGQLWSWARRLLGFTFLSLATLACYKDLGELASRAERRFWSLLGCALGSWWTLAGIFLFFPIPRKPALIHLVSEVLLALYYIIAFAAFEKPPHHGDGQPSSSVGRTWSLPAISIFVLGLTAYFVGIPLIFDFAAYLTFLPSMGLYVVLDLGLAWRAGRLARHTRQPRWRAVYMLLTAAFSCIALTDLADALGFAGLLGWQRGTAADLIIVPQFVILILAVRARHLPFPRRERSLHEEYFDERLPALGRQTMTFAFALSILHFAGYGAEIFDENVRWARELLVGVGLVIFGVVALLQQRALDKRAQSLWITRAKQERMLQKRAHDLRLMMHRRRNAAVLDAAEDRFASLLEVLEEAGADRLDAGRRAER